MSTTERIAKRIEIVRLHQQQHLSVRSICYCLLVSKNMACRWKDVNLFDIKNFYDQPRYSRQKFFNKHNMSAFKKEIEKGKYASTSIVAAKYKCSKRTVQREIKIQHGRAYRNQKEIWLSERDIKKRLSCAKWSF